jgi:hypothetical protein
MAAAAGVGVGLQMMGAIGSTIAEIRAAKQRAAIGDFEAGLSEQQAAFDERQNRRQHRLLQGEGNALAASSGLDITRGSPLLLELDRIRQGEIDAQSIRRAGTLEAQAKRMGAGFERDSIPYSILGGLARVGSIGASAYGQSQYLRTRRS